MADLRIIISCNSNFNDYDYMKRTVLGILGKRDFNIERICFVSGYGKRSNELVERLAYELSLTVYVLDEKRLYKRKNKSTISKNEELVRFTVKDNNYGMLIAFWDGVSECIKNIIDLAIEQRLNVYVIDCSEQKKE